MRVCDHAYRWLLLARSLSPRPFSTQVFESLACCHSQQWLQISASSNNRPIMETPEPRSKDGPTNSQSTRRSFHHRRWTQTIVGWICIHEVAHLEHARIRKSSLHRCRLPSNGLIRLTFAAWYRFRCCTRCLSSRPLQRGCSVNKTEFTCLQNSAQTNAKSAIFQLR